MCIKSKKFDNFSIQGPSIIYLSEKEVYFNLKFDDYKIGINSNWDYEWIILNGSGNAKFVGFNTQMLKMIILKPGLISFAISINNKTCNGYKQHNLTIYDHKLFPIAKVENISVNLPLNYAVLNAENSVNSKYFKWIPENDLPAKMVIASSLNDSKLFLVNLTPGSFLFNLTVWNDHSPFNNTKIVEISVFGGNAEQNLIEMSSSFNNFTFKYLNKLIKEIEQIILEFENDNNYKVLVKFVKMDSKTSFFGNDLTLFHFYASKCSTKNKEIFDAEQIIFLLKNNLAFKRRFGVLQIVPYYCKSCSGHGKCDNLSKTCVCDDFWMPNIFEKITHNGRNMDCSWPSLLVWFSLFFATYLLAKCLLIYWNNQEQKKLEKSKLIEALLFNYNDEKPVKQQQQIGKFSPFKIAKKRRGGGRKEGEDNNNNVCLNEFKRMFLEYSAKNNQNNSNNLKKEEEEEADDSIYLEEFDSSSSSN